ncbi:MAG: hypothetical protein COT81_04770 [Candidatus Buchananbacteria bacterium CG10_big_fil_rev_8_21_14_0_10_42_9]|uniref:Methyltransferase domain-containing protein n=1 Tax=Candidatus Buchananbacteria bacterium CG10_big_fil_rev_8_21_14_0_10_42_9 TaxID=1974526 RepID=A0A2H0W2C3_9BACT|nr:MAG: hypothetical protein COT81_04770 [Candidatus Buchananbacteria bacterium CG10_big_fil_rev_8_21_14_0_10_42_9]
MSKFYNRTRKSESISSKLFSQGRLHLIPLYYLLRLSDLSREGIENSGSYQFADHIYGNQASGRLIIGKLLDKILLSLKSAQSFRARYLFAKVEIDKLINQSGKTGKIKILAVPCGLAREMFETIESLEALDNFSGNVEWHGIDLDVELINQLKTKAAGYKSKISFRGGNAFSELSWGSNKYDMIISMGFTEFLTDDDTMRFFRLAKKYLVDNGRLVTSAMTPHKLSDYLLRNIAELHTYYRDRDNITELVDASGLSPKRVYQDQHGLQTMVIAQPK